jgi:site-specific DNA-methyltransferase (adenine-specific)
VPYFETSGGRKLTLDDRPQNVRQAGTTNVGRWPANVIHDGSDEVLAIFPKSESVGHHPSTRNGLSMWSGNGGGLNGNSGPEAWTDSGTAARFFYAAKTSQEDREEGLETLTPRQQDESRKGGNPGGDNSRNRGLSLRKNHHPTVKPTDLMRYLCRLVTPPGGVVLDPFCGSGSTGKAAMLEGLRFIGIELSAEYCELAQRRIEAVTKQGSLFA